MDPVVLIIPGLLLLLAVASGVRWLIFYNEGPVQVARSTRKWKQAKAEKEAHEKEVVEVAKGIRTTYDRSILKEAARLCYNWRRFADAAALMEKAKDVPEAARMYKEAFTAEKKANVARRDELLAKSAEMYELAGEHAEAAPLCAKVGMHDKGGGLYEKLGDYRKAGAAYSEAGLFESAGPMFEQGKDWSSAGDAYGKAHQPRRAVKNYRRAGLSDKVAELYEELGDVDIAVDVSTERGFKVGSWTCIRGRVMNTGKLGLRNVKISVSGETEEPRTSEIPVLPVGEQRDFEISIRPNSSGDGVPFDFEIGYLDEDEGPHSITKVVHLPVADKDEKPSQEPQVVYQIGNVSKLVQREEGPVTVKDSVLVRSKLGKGAPADPVEKLQKLQELRGKDLISEAKFQSKRKKLLDQI